MARLTLCLATLATLACAAVATDHVLVLTGKTMDDAIKKHDKLIVEFYAPWCGHCKKLEPEYKKAAEQLKDEGIVLAKVDATEAENKEIAKTYGVQGFPTLKVFRGEAKASDYNGPREADGIVSYAKKIFGPASVEMTDAAALKSKTTKPSEVTVLGIIPEGKDSSQFKVFEDVASKLREEGSFMHAFDSSLAEDCTSNSDAASCKSATVILFKSWDTPVIVHKGSFTADDIVKFVEDSTWPELVALDRTAKNKKPLSVMFADKKPKMLGISKPDIADFEQFQDNLKTIQKSYKDIHVLYANPKGNDGALNFFGVTEADLPALLVHEPESNGKLMAKNIKTGDMLSWAEKYSKGEVEKTVKTEEIPEKNDEPVKVIVGKSLESYITSGKDVFIEFYAPWCGHCKNLAPTWEKLAKKLENHPDIVIAKFDATANDVPDIKGYKMDVRGFPTLYYVRGDTKTVISFGDKRELGDLVKFVQKNANPAALKVAPLTEDDDVPADTKADEKPAAGSSTCAEEAEEDDELDEGDESYDEAAVDDEDDEYEDVELTEEEMAMDEFEQGDEDYGDEDYDEDEEEEDYDEKEEL